MDYYFRQMWTRKANEATTEEERGDLSARLENFLAAELERLDAEAVRLREQREQTLADAEMMRQLLVTPGSNMPSARPFDPVHDAVRPVVMANRMTSI